MKTKQIQNLLFGNLIKVVAAKSMPKLPYNKSVKLIIAGSICGLFLATTATPGAFADDYTYVFTASPGQSTDFNGTTIEMEGNSQSFGSEAYVYNWNLLDTALPAGITSSLQITPGTSVLLGNDISDANLSDWSGEFDGVSSSFNFYSENGGVAGSGLVGDFVEGMPQIPSQYAYGSWTSESEAGGLDEQLSFTGVHSSIKPPSETDVVSSFPLASVPDAGSSFELLAGAMVTLGGGRFFSRRRKISFSGAHLDTVLNMEGL